MYEEARTSVRTGNENSKCFWAKVGLYQGSVLSPLLFVIVMDVVCEGIREGLPCELLYADDIVLIADTEDELRKKFLKWKVSMELKG